MLEMKGLKYLSSSVEIDAGNFPSSLKVVKTVMSSHSGLRRSTHRVARSLQQPDGIADVAL
jgi:hypothetical protein